MLPVIVCLPWLPTFTTTWRRTVPPFMSETVTMAVICAAVVKVRVTSALLGALTPSSKSQ